MSRGHVSFNRVSVSGDCGRYELWSEDFGPDGDNFQGLVGELVINIKAAAFQVLPRDNWIEANVFPPPDDYW